MKIFLSGSHGLIGSEVFPFFTQQGHHVQCLLRRKAGASSELDVSALEACDAVVHLAGEPVMGRWTAVKKQAIRDSRVNGTRDLCAAILRLPQPPKVCIAASAIGYYGSRGDEVLTEESLPGTGFLASVCQEWEQAWEPVRARGIRVALLRLGIVLSAKGGALRQMLPPFKLGLGGPIGNGAQFWSWVALEDAAGVIAHVLERADISGPVNVAAPEAVTQREFARTLGRVLNRPAVLPLPAFAARWAMGESADALALGSCRARPAKLEQSGYVFWYPQLKDALRRALQH